MAPVRSHTKSRQGCRTCKKRKVKCDETGFPKCNNCSKRGIECDWPASSAPSELSDPGEGSSQPVSPSIPQTQPSSPSHSFDMLSMELLYHYTTQTCHTVMENSSHWSSSPSINVNAFQVVVPELALSYPSLMHAVLAFSALHLHRTRNSMSRTDYYSLSCYHKQHFQSSPRLPICPDGSCPGNHSCTQAVSVQFMEDTFMGLHTFCEAISSVGKSPSLRLYQIIDWVGQQKATIDRFFSAHHSKLFNGPFATLIKSGQLELRSFWQNRKKGNAPSTISIRSIHKIFCGAPDDTELYESDTPKAYETAVYTLDICSQQFRAGARRRGVFAWPSMISSEFVELLKQQRPRALIILAHFCVMFQDIVERYPNLQVGSLPVTDEEKEMWWMIGANGCVEMVRGELPDESWRKYLDQTLVEAGYHSTVNTKAIAPRFEGYQLGTRATTSVHGMEQNQQASIQIQDGWDLSTLFPMDSSSFMPSTSFA